MLTGVPQAQAVEVALYTVEVPLEPGDPDARTNAYRRALTEVLIRVTGTTAAAESEELALLFPNPARYVMQYRPGPDNTLLVSLDGPAIERELRQFGATVWDSDRPLTIVWLAVDWGQGEREIVAADDPERFPGEARSIDRNRLLRERVQEVAERRGLPILFPLLDTEDLENISFSDIWGGFDAPLLFASARYEADSVLVGRIRAEDFERHRWTWYFDGQRQDWTGEPEEAVNLLADSLAAQFAFSGSSPMETISLTISGIDSVVAYGKVQQLMENLRVADSVSVESAAGDRITYVVQIQGGAERLENALTLSGILESSGYGINEPFPVGQESLEYTYRPN